MRAAMPKEFTKEPLPRIENNLLHLMINFKYPFGKEKIILSFP